MTTVNRLRPAPWDVGAANPFARAEIIAMCLEVLS